MMDIDSIFSLLDDWFESLLPIEQSLVAALMNQGHYKLIVAIYKDHSGFPIALMNEFANNRMMHRMLTKSVLIEKESKKPCRSMSRKSV